jgi:hypothetical protein
MFSWLPHLLKKALFNFHISFAPFIPRFFFFFFFLLICFVAFTPHFFTRACSLASVVSLTPSTRRGGGVSDL